MELCQCLVGFGLVSHDASVIDQRDACADVRDVSKIVTRDDHRHPLLSGHSRQMLFQLDL